jgi:uncharacterized protein (TIGR03000 family)
MTWRGLTAAAVLAGAFLMVRPDPVAAQHWRAYYPGAKITYDWDPPDLFLPYNNLNWPSQTQYFTYGVGGGTYKVYYPNPEASVKYYYQTPKAGIAVPESTAQIEIKLPASDADLWIEGVRTSKSGSLRTFQSPPLVIGRAYEYEIRAYWYDGIKDKKVKTRIVKVRAGDRLSIEFTEDR